MTNYLLVGILMIASCSVVQKDRIGKIKSVTILGNSIVKHGPRPEVGWYGDWGMAASAQDKDFVHLLKAQMPGIDVKFKNIAEFERNFTTYNLSQLDSFKSDMVIIRISENVSSVDSFLPYYNKLIDYFPGSVMVLVDGIWSNGFNDHVKEIAEERGLMFVLNSDLGTPENMAGHFKDEGVKVHPSDVGMLAIKNRIWEKVKVYFL